MWRPRWNAGPSLRARSDSRHSRALSMALAARMKRSAGGRAAPRPRGSTYSTPVIVPSRRRCRRRDEAVEAQLAAAAEQRGAQRRDRRRALRVVRAAEAAAETAAHARRALQRGNRRVGPRVDRRRVAERRVAGLRRRRSESSRPTYISGRRRHRIRSRTARGERDRCRAMPGDAGDVLGFGVERLELVVGQRPVDEAGAVGSAARVAQRRGEAEVDLVEARVLHVGVDRGAADGAVEDVDVRVRLGGDGVARRGRCAARRPDPGDRTERIEP